MLTKTLSFIYRIPRLIVIGLLKFYKLAISPFFPPRCRYLPTCSTYGIQALQKYGFAKGIILAIWRFLRCNPWGGTGYDPPRWFGEVVVDIAGEVPPACGCEDNETCDHENRRGKDDDS